MSFDDEKFSIVSESIPLPRGLEAAQILTSDAFGPARDTESCAWRQGRPINAGLETAPPDESLCSVQTLSNSGITCYSNRLFVSTRAGQGGAILREGVLGSARDSTVNFGLRHSRYQNHPRGTFFTIDFPSPQPLRAATASSGGACSIQRGGKLPRDNLMARNEDTKITYATMTVDRMEELHRELDVAIEQVQQQFGRSHDHFIGGQPVFVGRAVRQSVSPTIAASFSGGFPRQPRNRFRTPSAPLELLLPPGRRCHGVSVSTRSGASAIKFGATVGKLVALMGFEAGKNRLECLGDVEETADLIAYYCDQVELHDGFVKPMDTLGPNEENLSLLRPHGVWAVISPFNFPMALAGGPAGAALVAGNTVILKPATDTPFVGLRLAEMTVEAGVPPGVFNVLMGGGPTVGQALVDNPDVGGVVFTGSKLVGMQLIRSNAARSIPRPFIAEMGGKNPALVMASADLDKAAEGVMRSAFGAQGQKCSACSRVYVAHEVRDQFLALLAEKTAAIRTGNPLVRDVWHGPLINARAVATFERAVEEGVGDGGRVVTGGRRLTDGPHAYGHYVEPTIIDGLTPDHRLFTDELFVPITVVAGIDSLEEGLDLANATEYGLTAGIFSEDEQEISTFFDRIEAGVCYANRRANATAGAWPGVNPFGGWKVSGSSGRGSGGPYYVQQFLREQSRVRVK